MKRLLDVPELAKLTGWSEPKTRRKCADGTLPAINTNAGGKFARWAVPVDEFERWLSGGKKAKQPTERRKPIDANVKQVFA